jgi:hypothetical protein
MAADRQTKGTPCWRGIGNSAAFASAGSNETRMSGALVMLVFSPPATSYAMAAFHPLRTLAEFGLLWFRCAHRRVALKTLSHDIWDHGA